MLLDATASADFEKGAEAYKQGDYSGAIQKWRPLAEKGDMDAQFNLGLMYHDGLGVPRDSNESDKWYKLSFEGLMKAALKGDSYAQHSLGFMYNFGAGAPLDNKEAMKWYTFAAGNGNRESQHFIGSLYELGEGVPRNKSEAIKWYTKSAEAGNAYSQATLGRIYETGDGVPQDNMEAAKWYKKAAEQGHAPSQYGIGVLCEKGEGISRDYIEAYKWLFLALSYPKSQLLMQSKKYRNMLQWSAMQVASTGFFKEQVDKALERISKKMTNEQMDEAKRSAREWAQRRGTI
jgi:TPR repeat protein